MSSKVYFIKASISEGEKAISDKAQKLFIAGNFSQCFAKNDFTAIKVHVGEDGNNTHIPAPCIKGLVDELHNLGTVPFVTDSSTLYIGNRSHAVNHMVLADKHDFNLKTLGVPFIVSDGLLGATETSVEINCPLNKEVYIGAEYENCQSILSIAHFTGHIASGFGATLKTLGMGCASKRGKLQQHASLKLSIGNNCKLCGVCLKHCPADAITLGKIHAHIDQDKCIGCAECMAFCRFNAVECNWGMETEVIQQSIAEYAFGVLKNKKSKAVFFNFVMSVTKDCDCFGTPNMKMIVDDIGIVASTDPVSVDKAALDLVENKTGSKLQDLIGNNELDPNHQLRHAENIGLGSSSYELIEIE
ncbi:MAG: DUF362 domain-containing protein [Sedimentisphaerales bacterium]|nr:DUF362 domain-containing protein [Sedimentisphaerales bacterium]